MAKDTWGLHLIAIGKVFFRLINCSIILQFQGSFQKHLSPHQFKVLTPRGYETIPFGIRALLDLHPDWVLMQVNVENIFNSVFQIVILK
jgi:hypothetical protein